MANWKDYLTQDGKKWLEFFKHNVLGEFYDGMNGCLLIEDKDMDNNIMQLIQAFLSENDGWVLGHSQEAELWYVEQK